MRRAIPTTLAPAFVFAPTVALAHAGHGDTSALLSGFTHPLTGIDHVLAMVAVGVLAAQFGGRALWLVPLSFISIMAIGGVLGMAGILIPFAEVGVALSVVVLGLTIAFPFRLQSLVAVALAGLFALFHGQVHGAEIPAAASGLYYTAGFIGATALLHLTGIGLGLFALETKTLGNRVVQAGGGGTALFGAAILIGVL
ncbi:HupE/UreJ family protein [Bradyrhizobium sp. LVM 105]|uniref:HupE/UreJ family protein n=2 Tax=Bradyrhizobium frederickii TaxID=2560054 RepID=A0A4Y9KWC0_9BRAD|nr:MULTISPECIES: HupE/UreJ family protein [Bradyrhizobium]RTE94259.1 urease accessory protein [Bradyrhizobium sp. LVM 105]TFV30680.1 HupE/UreJ family protein [Bradyrhizobium frederickii]